MTSRRVELQIGELVLDVASAADAPRIGAALERELARLLSAGGVPEHSGTVDSTAPVELEQRAGESASAFGVRLAGAVYGRLGP